MDWRRYRRDAVAFPTPCPTRNVYYPHLYPGYRRYPNDLPERTPREERAWRKVDGISDFLDEKIAYSGDLGWTLDYATAWCYRHLIGSQPEVADVIDHVRELGTVSPKTPYYIFDYLDKAIFGGKLEDMVYLRWRCQSSCSTGTTSAPNVEGIPRICVELNMTPFEDDQADIDDLLEALIHQMIHAYFLVCCGAQKKDDYQDGRLMDGLHFGVILLTIKDITKQCVDGVLSLVFHAFKRREYESRLPLATPNAFGPNRAVMPPPQSKSSYISLDPRGSAIGPAAADGQTHCMHDNRKITWQQIKNWQVEHYARAIELHMDLKGIDIYDLDANGVLVQHSRLHVDPSTTYVELLWDEKRIMIPRAKCLMFPSLERPITKLGQFDLLIPRCDFATFKCIYDFIQLETYRTSEYDLVRNGATVTKGPPVYMPPADSETPSELPSIEANIKVFKAAEQMKFEEMQYHALAKLWNADMTGDDPIKALRVLYNEDDREAGPVHSELHRWARRFMVRKEDGLDSSVAYPHMHRGLPHDLGSFWEHDTYAAMYPDEQHRGVSNFEKMLKFHGPNFKELYSSNRAFQDDVNIARNELMLGGDLDGDTMRPWNSVSSPLSGLSSLPILSGIGPMQPSLRLPRRRSLSSSGGRMGAAWASPRLHRGWDDLATIPAHHGQRLAVPGLLPQRLLGPNELIDPYGRDGRYRARGVVPGERMVRFPAHQWRI